MSRFHNRTRRAASIPRKLVRERKPWLIPVYYAMLTSALAREGIRNSGSYRFADHIYAGRPRGRFLVGRALDALLLRLPSARAFRSRYLYAREEIERFVSTAPPDNPIDVLAVPSGYARELIEAADALRIADPAAYERVRWHGLDLDTALVEEMRERARAAGHPMEFRAGDALDASAYPTRYNMIVSLGFTEFLDDETALGYLTVVRSRLGPGGRLVTSGMRPHRVSDYLLRNIGELHTHYRTEGELRALCARAGFGCVRTYDDPTGLQTMVVAEE